MSRTRLLFFLLFALSICGLLAAQEPADTPRVKRTPSYTAQGTDACLRCHSGDKMRAIAASPHGNAEKPHTPAAGQGCESCHGPGSIHVSRAHGGAGFPPLTSFGRGSGASPREEQLRPCLACHAQKETATQVIEFIGSAHDRRTINCSSCHSVHVESDAMRDREQQLATCIRCHRRHLEEHPRFEDKSIDFDALACATCHDVHSASSLADRATDTGR